MNINFDQKSIVNFCKRNRSSLFLLFLLLLAFLLRYFRILDHVFPFGFDHGKDHLAVLDLLWNKDIKLIGPWTSIPGLYFGPFWYYLLAPGLLLTKYDPIGSVYVMIFLVLVQVWFSYKYLSKTAALLIATTPFWVMISTSAWNPFPMTFLSLLIYYLLVHKTVYKKPTSKWVLFSLGFVASLGFHFSSAFAIFYLFIILSYLLIKRVKFSIKAIFMGILGFILPFLPQTLFELTHNFSQTKAVLDYFTHNHEQVATNVFGQAPPLALLGLVKISVLPELSFYPYNKLILLGLGFLLIFVLSFLIYKHKLWIKLKDDFLLLFLFTFIPLLGFTKLHFNIWYVYPIVSIYVVVVGKILDYLKLKVKILLWMFLVATSLFSLYYYLSFEKQVLAKKPMFLSNKLDVVNKIREIAKDKPYAVYIYEPDIYDFAYQYIYLWQAKNGKKLPTEVAYKPDAETYIIQKPALLRQVSKQEDHRKPEYIFLIIEPMDKKNMYADAWKNQLPTMDQIHEEKVNDITIIQNKL